MSGAAPPTGRPAGLPAATANLSRARDDLLEHGLCLIAGALPDAMLRRAREALYRAAADDRTQPRGSRFALDLDDANQRVWNLLNRDPAFVALAEHPIAIELVRAVLGWPALLSNISGNVTGPGSVSGMLHADQIFVPEPWPPSPQGVNVAWCIDDFTVENGATQVVPGSHRWNRMAGPDDGDVGLTSVTAPAGSLFAFDSRIWHRTGPNASAGAHRAGVFAFYTRPIYRTQENWFLSLSADVVRNASDTLLTLLAYRSEGFGLVDGRSPHESFDQDRE